MLQGELHAGPVVGGEGGNAEIDARQVQSLFRAQGAADHYPGVHHVLFDRLDPHLDETVVDEQDIVRFDHSRQFGQAHRDQFPVADQLTAGEGETAAHGQFHRFLGQGADTDLRAGQVGHDGHRPLGDAGSLADAADDLAVGAEVAVGEIEPGDVHAGEQHFLEHFRRIGGRTDGADQFGLVGGQTGGCVHADSSEG